MARQYDFGNNQILRPEFLNTLQKILQSYLDIFLLEASGNQVLAPATLDDPISVNIDRRMRRVSSTLAVTLVGAPGVYDVFFVVRPEEVVPIELVALPQGDDPTVSDHEAFRHVGEAEFDGALVTSVTTYPVRTGADMLAGRSSGYEPYPFGIPVADENGRLHPDWFPDTATKVETIGTIRRQYVFPGQTLEVGDDWVIMEGQTLLPSEHGFGGGSITLPDPRNRVARGANLAKAQDAAGSAGNTAAAAPGLGGTSGSNVPRNLDHTHPVDPHRHSVAGHTHPVPSHSHTHLLHSHTDPANSLHFFPGATDHTIQVGTPVGQGVAPGTSGPRQKSPVFGGPINTSDPSGGPLTDYAAEGSSLGPSVDLTSEDVRPAHVGLVYLLKVF